MSTIEQQRYIGDGVYAHLDPAIMIILKTERPSNDAPFPLGTQQTHWIALEPDVLRELIIFACEIGWRKVIDRALEIATRRGGEHDSD